MHGSATVSPGSETSARPPLKSLDAEFCRCQGRCLDPDLCWWHTKPERTPDVDPLRASIKNVQSQPPCQPALSTESTEDTLPPLFGARATVGLRGFAPGRRLSVVPVMQTPKEWHQARAAKQRRLEFSDAVTILFLGLLVVQNTCVRSDKQA